MLIESLFEYLTLMNKRQQPGNKKVFKQSLHVQNSFSCKNNLCLMKFGPLFTELIMKGLNFFNFLKNL